MSDTFGMCTITVWIDIDIEKIDRAALSSAEVNDWLKPLGKYQVAEDAAPAMPAAALPAKSAQTYKPLLILLAYLLLVIAAASIARVLAKRAAL